MLPVAATILCLIAASAAALDVTFTKIIDTDTPAPAKGQHYDEEYLALNPNARLKSKASKFSSPTAVRVVFCGFEIVPA